MRLSFVFFAILFINGSAYAQQKKAYQIFNAKGKKVSYKKMLKSCKSTDLLFFGELHNNSIAHWLQFELSNDLLNERELILGAEMFEADNQDALDKFIKNEIDDETFAKEARLWKNYSTDYSPLVELAKNNELKFIATNVPRRYASMVYKKGTESLDTLTLKEKEWIAPLPFAFDIELPSYKKMLSMGGGHGGENLPKAQAIKDATMAHFILQNHKAGQLFIHYNGAYHSDYKEGIIWHIRQTNSQFKIMTISTVNQEQLKKLNKEHLGKADFIICVDENMTKTY